ncbi:hypothetical protein [Thermosipho affectus]|nr:hypothetical protein [Thermosipho affectus]
MKTTNFNYSKLKTLINSYVELGYEIEYYIFFEKEWDLEFIKKFINSLSGNGDVIHFNLKNNLLRIL